MIGIWVISEYIQIKIIEIDTGCPKYKYKIHKIVNMWFSGNFRFLKKSAKFREFCRMINFFNEFEMNLFDAT